MRMELPSTLPGWQADPVWQTSPLKSSSGVALPER